MCTRFSFVAKFTSCLQALYQNRSTRVSVIYKIHTRRAVCPHSRTRQHNTTNRYHVGALVVTTCLPHTHTDTHTATYSVTRFNPYNNVQIQRIAHRQTCSLPAYLRLSLMLLCAWPGPACMRREGTSNLRNEVSIAHAYAQNDTERERYIHGWRVYTVPVYTDCVKCILCVPKKEGPISSMHMMPHVLFNVRGLFEL